MKKHEAGPQYLPSCVDEKVLTGGSLNRFCKPRESVDNQPIQQFHFKL